MIEEPVRAWLSALIDGEGSVMLNKRTHSGNSRATTRTSYRPSYRPVVVVAATTDYRLMTAIKVKIGVGQIYEHRVSNTKPSNNPRARRQWTYRLNVGQIEVVLPQLLDWLVLKEEQARLLLEAMAIKRTTHPNFPGWHLNLPDARIRLDEIYTAIRKANTRGRTLDEPGRELESQLPNQSEVMPL